MMDKLTYLAATGAGMAIAAPFNLQGMSPLTSASIGIVVSALSIAIWGSYKMGYKAAQHQNGEVAQ